MKTRGGIVVERFNKVLIAAFGLVLAFTLAGCGGAGTNSSSKDQSKDTSSSQTQRPTTSSEQSSTSNESISSALSALGDAAKNVQESNQAANQESNQEANQESSQESNTNQETKRVGEAGIGFVDIPANYVNFVDVESNTDLQYSDALGKDIFTLNVLDLSALSDEERAAFDIETAGRNLWANIESEGATDVNGAHVTLLGRDAVQVYGTYPDGVILVMILVQDDAGVIHYISVESDNIDTLNMMIDLIETTYAFDA